MSIRPHRTTFSIKFEIEPAMGWKPWKWNTYYRGFDINFGVFGMTWRIRLVLRNYS